MRGLRPRVTNPDSLSDDAAPNNAWPRIGAQKFSDAK
jgi:hypothetical protein